ncbi:MAG: molybdopterin molybdotransferase MoeA [Candidatus Marinimicrobia bacterium]|nr:molybdopterin molybdotransferase MoeA [Candidatus Neomarinimicrobiota bacterium]
MISVGEAHELIQAALPAPAVESMAFTEVAGQVLAQDIVAPHPQPRFTNSAMDGFAVRAVDVQGASSEGPVALTCVDVVAAGVEAKVTIGPGECAQIMTGAPLPAGADAVVMVEQTSGYDQASVEVYHASQAGDNLRRAGEEVKTGQVLITAGVRIGPGELGIIASCGLEQVQVYRGPTVALYGTGDELREPGEDLLPGQIYNSNIPVLTRMVQLAGGEVALSRVIGDSKDALRTFLAEAIETCQMVVSTGGVSMGRFDFVRDVMLELGVEERFWKVAQKPGKPLFFGQSGSVMVFGLPGNPVSALIIFMEYIWPTLEQFQGLRPTGKLTAILAEPFPVDGGKHRFLFGQVWLEEGCLRAAPTRKLGSHMLTSALGANAILDAPPGTGPLRAEDPVSVRLLPWGAIHARRATP